MTPQPPGCLLGMFGIIKLTIHTITGMWVSIVLFKPRRMAGVVSTFSAVY
jgi:hypothetical protein